MKMSRLFVCENVLSLPLDFLFFPYLFFLFPADIFHPALLSVYPFSFECCFLAFGQEGFFWASVFSFLCHSLLCSHSDFQKYLVSKPIFYNIFSLVFSCFF